MLNAMFLKRVCVFHLQMTITKKATKEENETFSSFVAFTLLALFACCTVPCGGCRRYIPNVLLPLIARFEEQQ